jgi:hypothetical protein
MASRDFCHPQFRLLSFVHQHRAVLSVRIVSDAAPRPLFRFEHQAELYWVAVHIMQFFYPLSLAEYDKVIEAALPDVPSF